jgi:uncharacterized protein (DUF1330 family)
MSRWLQIAEQDDWQISKRDTSDNRDNSPTPAPNVASVTNVRVGEVAADEAGSPTKQFDDQFRHPMEPGPGAADDAWRKWREHLVRLYRHHGDRAVQYRGKADRALHGESNDHGLIIIVKFPSLEKINERYESDAYQPLKALRDEGSDMQIMSYEVMT